MMDEEAEHLVVCCSNSWTRTTGDDPLKWRNSAEYRDRCAASDMRDVCRPIAAFYLRFDFSSSCESGKIYSRKRSEIFAATEVPSQHSTTLRLHVSDDIWLTYVSELHRERYRIYLWFRTNKLGNRSFLSMTFHESDVRYSIYVADT